MPFGSFSSSQLSGHLALLSTSSGKNGSNIGPLLFPKLLNKKLILYIERSSHGHPKTHQEKPRIYPHRN